jgi:hypothetical protein
MLPALKTCNCRIVLLQYADPVLELLHCFPFFFVVPIFFLGGASKEIINHSFYGGIGWMFGELQQLCRG